MTLSRPEERRRWLKSVARERSAGWRLAVLHPALDGATVLETTRERLRFIDGCCIEWKTLGFPRAAGYKTAEKLVGTRLVAWVTADYRVIDEPGDPGGGGRAILWRDQKGLATLALTGTIRSFGTVMPLVSFHADTGSRTSVTLRSASTEATRNDIRRSA